jgi:hypothetical protein
VVRAAIVFFVVPPAKCSGGVLVIKRTVDRDNVRTPTTFLVHLDNDPTQHFGGYEPGHVERHSFSSSSSSWAAASLLPIDSIIKIRVLESKIESLKECDGCASLLQA